MKQILRKGFTLVELLIVIALIAILSVAVLSTINPIEQTNKARDSKFKNDAAEMLNAAERYYASTQRYQWTDAYILDPAHAYSVPDGTENIAFVSTDARFGIIGNGIGGDDYEEDGPLIKTSELKGAFAGKEEFEDAVDISSADAMYFYHSGGDNYVCFCPKAKANRTGPDASLLKCLSNVSEIDTAVNATGAQLIDVGVGTCVAPDEEASTQNGFCDVDEGGVYANLMCVPEGDIQ
jgi:prepilin-type N-terminal cleavage/methylation domain-containing protein